MKRVIESFKYPLEFNEQHGVYGASLLSGPVLIESGDFRNHMPKVEGQRNHGVEPSSCYIYGQQHAVEALEELQFGEIDNDYSPRFNALLSNGTPEGGDPILGGDSMRHDGLVKEEVMPFNEFITDWDKYHSWFGVSQQEVIERGQEYAQKRKLNFGVIIRREYPLETVYSVLRQALKRSPCPISVWGVTDNNGNYMPKPIGVSDTHMVCATYVDDQNRIHVRDTYEPYDKVLPANYKPDFGVMWAVRKVTAEDLSLLQKVFNSLWLGGLLKFFTQWWYNYLTPKIEIPEPLPPVVTPSEPIKKDYITPMAEAIKLFEGWAAPGQADRTGRVWKGGSLSWRNNNPGNLKEVSGNFAHYSSYEVGWAALLNYIERACTGKHKAYKPEMTIRQFFGVYSPDGNEIESNYASFVCKYMSDKLVEIIYPSKQLKDLV